MRTTDCRISIIPYPRSRSRQTVGIRAASIPGHLYRALGLIGCSLGNLGGEATVMPCGAVETRPLSLTNADVPIQWPGGVLHA